MPVTSADVARLAGVSRATVSYVINGKGQRFSEETRAAVLAAAADLGYQPQSAGRALVRGESDVVILAVPATPNGVFLQIATDLSSILADISYTLVLIPPAKTVAGFERTLRSIGPRLFLSVTSLSAAQEEVLERTNSAWIDFGADASTKGGLHWRIGVLQAAHLIERGYTRLVYAGPEEAASDQMLLARQRGFVQECSERGLDTPQILRFSQRLLPAADLVSSLEPRTGVGCFNDDTAATVLRSAHLAGLTVPDDVGVVGVDDTPVALYCNPPLTTVAWDLEVMGAISEALITKARGRIPSVEVDVSARLVQRSSS